MVSLKKLKNLHLTAMRNNMRIMLKMKITQIQYYKFSLNWGDNGIAGRSESSTQNRLLEMCRADYFEGDEYNMDFINSER